MPSHLTIDAAMAAISTRARLRDSGMTARQIADAVARGDQRRLQRNRYVLSDVWSDLWPESRHLLEVCAAVGEMRDGDTAASHESAAVLHGLPLYRHVPSAVHVTTSDGHRMSSRPGLRRHGDRLHAEDVTVLHGIRCTTLERTIFDLARTISTEAGVAAADAALRRTAMRGTRYDEDAAHEWRQGMLDRCAAARGGRGIRRADDVIRFGDGRAESPGESVSRLQLTRLGFRRLRLQAPVRGPAGEELRVDIEIEDVRAFYEFDGLGKYADLVTASGRTLQQVLVDEKRREDWIRGTTQKRFARAESPHILTPAALGARLSSFGIVAPAR